MLTLCAKQKAPIVATQVYIYHVSKNDRQSILPVRVNEELVNNCRLSKHRPWTLALKMTRCEINNTAVITHNYVLLHAPRSFKQ